MTNFLPKWTVRNHQQSTLYSRLKVAKMQCIIRPFFSGRRRHTFGPNYKNSPKMRLKNSWKRRIILVPATVWQTLNVEHRQATGNGSCINFRKLAWKNSWNHFGWTYFRRVLAIWNHFEAAAKLLLFYGYNSACSAAYQGRFLFGPFNTLQLLLFHGLRRHESGLPWFR